MLNFQTIFDWSEAWAPLVPLAVSFRFRKQPAYLRPVLIYLWLSLALHLAADIIWKRKPLGLDLPFTNNNPLYNLASIARFFLFSWFFIRLQQPFLTRLKALLPYLFIIFMVVDLFFLENFWDTRIANVLHAAEAGLLLFYCLLYYLCLLRSDAVRIGRMPSFWVVTGLIIFVAVCLPIYIYYNDLLKSYVNFAINIWSVPKIGFLILCLAITIGLSINKKANTLPDE
ncbi:MAG: hypothetical protein EOO14_01010 [Chitinophagaceae bacterium]|nr:MAG: hypothetical protein EOO14_01010 [Chitinophagaceae bacterium]